MSLQRSLRRWASLLAASAIVFAQTAVAAHACAAALAGTPPVAHGAMDHVMPDGHDGHDGCCDEPSVVQDDLCFQHCLTEQQSVDPHTITFSAPFAGPARYAGHHDRSYASLQARTHALLAHVTAPPLSVRNCCFRT